MLGEYQAPEALPLDGVLPVKGTLLLPDDGEMSQVGHVCLLSFQLLLVDAEAGAALAALLCCDVLCCHRGPWTHLPQPLTHACRRK